VRLSELSPKWVNDHVFIFLCPHCGQVYLSCKSIVLDEDQQNAMYEAVLSEEKEPIPALMEYLGSGTPPVVLCKEEFKWSLSSHDFETLTVSPSIDASNSGHWHGHISQGTITP
jgi:hypothetical protein